MSEDVRKLDLYERALAQIRIIATSDMGYTSPDHAIAAIISVLEAVGITAKVAQYYKNESAKT